MKIFSTTKPALYIKGRPQEDFLLFSKSYPIFAVADGVTLGVANEAEYPKKSGAFSVAKILCEKVIFEAKRKYKTFEKKDLAEIFKSANRTVYDYNLLNGRTGSTINYYDFDFFSATGAFSLIKNSKVYWWSLCDSGVKLFNKNGKKIFSSPDGWINFPKNWNEKKGDVKKISLRHKKYRNAQSPSGKLLGYGAATGEASAEDYLNYGELKLCKGDMIFLHTDGFENYFGIEDFINLFLKWPKDIQGHLDALIAKKSKEDIRKYGAEKSLIAILL